VNLIDASGRVVIESEAFRAGFRSAGRFSKQLPAGRTRIRVSRGFETKVEEKEVVLEAGRKTAVEFRLSRVVDLRRLGWFAGDSHAHTLHGERTVPVSFDDAALAAQAEIEEPELADEELLGEATLAKLSQQVGLYAEEEELLGDLEVVVEEEEHTEEDWREILVSDEEATPAPAVEEQPAVEDQSAVEEQPAVEDQPAVEEQPVVKDQPATEEQPSTGEA
jgi:hypothetical protein